MVATANNWAKATELAIISSASGCFKYNIFDPRGENPGLQLGDMKTVGKTGYDGNNLRYMNTVAGGNLDWLYATGLKSSDLFPFHYPASYDFEENDVQIVYLGWFWNDWSLVNNGKVSVANGLDIRKDLVDKTGDITRVSSLDEDWVTLNQMIKYYKFGFGRVTDYANEAIRYGHITRDSAIKLVEQYDGSCSDAYIKSSYYISISVDFFWGMYAVLLLQIY